MSSVLSLLWPLLVLAVEIPDDPGQVLAKAARLVSSAKIEQASRLLHHLKEEYPDYSPGKRLVIEGLLFMKKEDFKLAYSKFNQSLHTDHKDPLIQVYLARSAEQQKHHEVALMHLKRAESLFAQMPTLFIMKASNESAISKDDLAFITLQRGLKIHPEDSPLFRAYLKFCSKNGLLQRIRTRLLSAKHPVSFYQAGIRVFITNNEIREGLILSEGSILMHPYNPDLLKLHAHLLRKNRRVHNAAQIMERAAHLEPKNYHAAAALWLEAGSIEKSRYLNHLIKDRKTQVRMRLALFLQEGRFTEAYSLKEGLNRMGLYQDDEIRYGLAFAAFQMGRPGLVKKHLQGITNDRVFKQATRLLQMLNSRG